MRSTPARNHERLSGGKLRRSIGRPSPAGEASASSNRTGLSKRCDIYGRPDLYDMEYAGASNEDAHFFVAWSRASALVACWSWRAARAGSPSR
jgi:hypothetical protein